MQVCQIIVATTSFERIRIIERSGTSRGGTENETGETSAIQTGVDVKLIELLTVTLIIVILASMGVPAVVKAGKGIKRKWFEINMWHGDRLNAVLNDETPKSTVDYYLTNGANPQKYYWNLNPSATQN